MAKYTAQSRILFGIINILTFAYKRLVSIANGQIPRNKDACFCRRIIILICCNPNKMAAQILVLKSQYYPPNINLILLID